MAHQVEPRVIFITGTDTGVGKTVLTCLLLSYLRQIGCRILALKPFCTGSRDDAEILLSLQLAAEDLVTENRQSITENPLTIDEINPFYFRKPLAPLVATRQLGRRIPLAAVLEFINSIARKFEVQCSKFNDQSSRSSPAPLDPRQSSLLIEGIGGLLVPLGPGYSVIDLIRALKCEVVVASSNRLGTINHTLLTVNALQAFGIQRIKTVVMDASTHRNSTPDTRSNVRILTELLAPVPVFRIPYLGPKPLAINAIKENGKKLKKTLAQILK